MTHSSKNLASLTSFLKSIRIESSDERVDQAERALQASSQWIINYLNRELVYRASYTEKLRGYGWPRLAVSLYPIIEVTEVKIEGKVVDDFEVYHKEGILHRDHGWPSVRTWEPSTYLRQPSRSTEKRTIEVTYTGGYVTPDQAGELGLERTLPADIEMACLELATNYFWQQGKDPRVRRNHSLRTGTWYDTEELLKRIAFSLAHYRQVS